MSNVMPVPKGARSFFFRGWSLMNQKQHAWIIGSWWQTGYEAGVRDAAHRKHASGAKSEAQR